MTNARKPYKKYTVDNSVVQEELLRYESWDALPLPYQDIIYGACGQCRGAKRISHQYVAYLLTCLSKINVDTAADTLNRKRSALGDKPLTLRMVQYYAAILRCASQGLTHQLWKQSRAKTIPLANTPNPKRQSYLLVA